MCVDLKCFDKEYQRKTIKDYSVLITGCVLLTNIDHWTSVKTSEETGFELQS